MKIALNTFLTIIDIIEGNGNLIKHDLIIQIIQYTKYWKISVPNSPLS